MVEHCIVYTLEKSKDVAIVYPAAECVESLQHGHAIDQSVRGRQGLRGFLFQTANYTLLQYIMATFNNEIPLDVAKEWEKHKMLSEPLWNPLGNREKLAYRWVEALAHGGVSYEEAIRMVGEKDRPVGGCAMEIVLRSDIPNDRWFRNAWKRSQNGGPIYIDLNRARLVQKHQYIAKLQSDLAKKSLWDRVTLDSKVVDFKAVEEQIFQTDDLEVLRLILPAV